MHSSKCYCTVLAITFVTLVVLVPAVSEAGLLDCLWGGSTRGQAQTTYTPRYVAPAVYYPTASATPAGPLARLRAAWRSSQPPSGTTCYYVPEVSYRQVIQPTAVTSYVPVVTRDACTGYPVTVYQPVVTYNNQVRLVPQTTYRLVCTRSQYGRATYTAPVYAGAVPAYAPASGGSCQQCAPVTTYYSPASSVVPASNNFSAVPAGNSFTNNVGTSLSSRPVPTSFPQSAASTPTGGTYGGPVAGAQVVNGSGFGSGAAGGPTTQPSGTWSDGRGVPQSPSAPGATGGAALQPVPGSAGRSGIGPAYAAPGNWFTDGAASGGAGGLGAQNNGGAARNNGGWPQQSNPESNPAVPPAQFQQPFSRPIQQWPQRSAPAENTQPQSSPAGPSLIDPSNKTAMTASMRAEGNEPIRGRLVPVERLHIPGDNSNNSVVPAYPVSGAWSIVRN